MKLVLRQDVSNVGKKGDIIDVELDRAPAAAPTAVGASAPQPAAPAAAPVPAPGPTIVEVD